MHAPAGLAGETIAIDGLSANRTDVLVRIERLNVGVELGQLIFIAAVMAVFMILRRVLLRFFGSKASRTQAWLRLGAACCIGAVAAFWLLERIGGF